MFLRFIYVFLNTFFAAILFKGYALNGKESTSSFDLCNLDNDCVISPAKQFQSLGDALVLETAIPSNTNTQQESGVCETPLLMEKGVVHSDFEELSPEVVGNFDVDSGSSLEDVTALEPFDIKDIPVSGDPKDEEELDSSMPVLLKTEKTATEMLSLEEDLNQKFQEIERIRERFRVQAVPFCVPVMPILPKKERPVLFKNPPEARSVFEKSTGNVFADLQDLLNIIFNNESENSEEK